MQKNAHVVNMKPFGYCAQTLDNPHFPKACAGSNAQPVGGRFKCVDDKGFPLPPEDCNPLWQMIGNDWNAQGVNMPYLASRMSKGPADSRKRFLVDHLVLRAR